MYMFSDIELEFNSKLPLFERARKNLSESVELFLKEHKIDYLTVSGRVKSFDSFIDKVERKKYQNPFLDNEDFIGIRIILFYPQDIDKVIEILNTEFILQDTIDKSNELEINAFGYRSNHIILKIKDNWLTTPNYRGLENVKIEFQIRTILMHAWAEISHKFAYKNKEQMPSNLERQLFLLSAGFENSDNQLQNFKDNIEKYRDEIKLAINVDKEKSNKFHLNYDSLSALLDYYLEGFPRNQNQAMNALERMKRRNYSFEQVEELLKKIQPIASKINESVFPNKKLNLSQGTLLAYADDIFNSYDPLSIISDKRRKIVEKFKKSIIKRKRNSSKNKS